MAHMAGPPDRGKDTKRKAQPLNIVRGGAVCQAGEKGGHIIKGSLKAAVCMPTVGPDPRSRWREAGSVGGRITGKLSRHSLHYLQHRQLGQH
jgi:hypothetical protein